VEQRTSPEKVSTADKREIVDQPSSQALIVPSNDKMSHQSQEAHSTSEMKRSVDKKPRMRRMLWGWNKSRRNKASEITEALTSAANKDEKREVESNTKSSFLFLWMICPSRKRKEKNEHGIDVAESENDVPDVPKQNGSTLWWTSIVTFVLISIAVALVIVSSSVIPDGLCGPAFPTATLATADNKYTRNQRGGLQCCTRLAPFQHMWRYGRE